MYIWQTKQWGEMLLKTGQVEHIFDIGGIQVEKRKIGLGQFGLFIIGVDYDIGQKYNESEIETTLVDLCIREQALFIQVEILNYSGELIKKFFDLSLMDYGFYKKFINQYTAIIDLSKSEEEILKDMKPKGRYNIKLAQKKGIEVKEVEKTEENVKLYYELMKQTTARDHFSGHSLDYYINFLQIIKNSKLLLAFKDNKAIAGGIFVFDKEVSIYYYGASTSDKEYRNMMAPYLVQWEAIKIAKSIKSEIYDFLGVAPFGIKDHPLGGVTNFKSKFTPDFRKVSESYIYIRKPFLYKILVFLRKIKNFFKK